MHFICLILPWYEVRAVKPKRTASRRSDAGARSPAPCGEERGASAGYLEALVLGCDSAQVAHRTVTTRAVFPAWHKVRCRNSNNRVPTLVSLGESLLSHFFFFFFAKIAKRWFLQLRMGPVVAKP